ncbi:hypothetical protein ENBRE01_0865 [Enteropsectra breve]|nr:hypothetical protein ENBRE01_0865 [Enteropsectra breve]
MRTMKFFLGLVLLCIESVRASSPEERIVLHMEMEEIASDSDKPVYAIEVTSDNEYYGDLILMRNKGTNPKKWDEIHKEKDVLLGPERVTRMTYDGKVKEGWYYLVKIRTEKDDWVGFSYPVQYVDGEFVQLNYLSYNAGDGEYETRSYWSRHKTALIVFISLISVVFLLFLFTIWWIYRRNRDDREIADRHSNENEDSRNASENI